MNFRREDPIYVYETLSKVIDPLGRTGHASFSLMRHQRKRVGYRPSTKCTERTRPDIELQANRRRYAGTVSDFRKNRLTVGRSQTDGLGSAHRRNALS